MPPHQQRKGLIGFQTDHSALDDWETKCQMQFHPEKCILITVYINKRPRKNTLYILHGHVLDPVVCSKYLGVSIIEDLTWKKHVDNTAAKASRTLGFLHRNLSDCQKEARSTAYSAMVQLTLDYASTSWDPHAYQR